MLQRRLGGLFNFFMFAASGLLSVLGLASILGLLNTPKHALAAAIIGGLLGAIGGSVLIIQRSRRHPFKEGETRSPHNQK